MPWEEAIVIKVNKADRCEGVVFQCGKQVVGYGLQPIGMWHVGDHAKLLRYNGRLPLLACEGGIKKI
jgi:hypothetical protein